MTTTRFAPSPNGPLHWGHAFSAIVAHDLAREAEGRFLLRIEDIDGPRSRPELADEFRRDLEWLGLEWEEVPAQSTRLENYRAVAARLETMGLLYPCTCTRKEIEKAGASTGPDPGSWAGAGGLVYPGTCKGRAVDPAEPAALRLDVEKALALTGPLAWEDDLAEVQQANPLTLGDVVLVRKDLPASYHLAATLDDAADGVTLVTRGRDLFAATHVHRLLQALLGLPVPRWHHHALLLDESGQKLAKRRGSPALSDHRLAGEDGHAWADRLRTGQWPSGISLGKA
ncbi:tRNA glutamyl-Q(34) synthetase GluQRS [Erythrobacter sp. SDW2]|uniref:tRNA glutamyl-Q(34) synthetase GluQRS n=1 Tax=Erythrobacter sp. SDW2 TaxID=2907154 RepID=UPI001F20C19C|nr:tRNA glutamyl-Q(34) synthetase GluQRS [Erythrobacter sp. SDW2]UIP07104.1 tRNA glutamyl-Q(34) synthetase GluQRS [Erythrobacter sp. SDW2]